MPVDNQDITARLAVLEHDAQHIQEELADIRRSLKDIKETLNKQKGFIAGIMFVVGPLFGFVILAIKSFWDRMSGH